MTARVARLSESDWRVFAIIRLRALTDSLGECDPQYRKEVTFTAAQWRRRLRDHAQFAALIGDRPVGGRARPRQDHQHRVSAVGPGATRSRAVCRDQGRLKMLTQGMCADWAPAGLQVDALAPGYIETELTRTLVDDPEFSRWLRGRTPAARWGTVEDLVGALLFLSSPASDFVNGHTLYVDGGMLAVV